MAKCRDCGLLALREHGTMVLVEAPMPYRDRGKVPLRTDLSNREACERVPVCYENLRLFDLELGTDSLTKSGIAAAPQPRERLLGRIWDIDPGIIDKNLAYEVIEKEFDCPSFIQHRQGMSPQEHREMLDRQHVQQREDHRDLMARLREDARDKRVDKREDDRDEAVERRHRKEIRWFGGIVAGATLVASIIGAGATLGAARWLSDDANPPVLVVTATVPPAIMPASTPVAIRTP